LIDWKNARFKQSGDEFRLFVKSITIECYDDYASNQAYKYIRNKETKNELAFKVVDLKGYGVSLQTIPAMQLQSISSQALDGTTKHEPVPAQAPVQAKERDVIIPLPNRLKEDLAATNEKKYEVIADEFTGEKKEASEGEAYSSSWTTEWSQAASSWSTSWSETGSSWSAVETSK